MSGQVGYVSFDGVCLANRAQTLAYLRNGLAGSGHNVSWDILNDRADCDCWVIDDYKPTAGWIDPETDEAEWYTPELPDSADFLGLYINGTGDTDGILGLGAPAFQRTIRSALGVGGRLGRLDSPPRSLTISGYLMASSDRGLEYGKKWLADVLQGCASGDCGLSDLCLYPVCPEVGGDPTAYVRTLKRVGLVSGPLYDTSDCLGPSSVRVTFQLAAEIPWLYLEPETILSEGEYTFDPSTPDECLTCCLVSCCETSCGKRESICVQMETAQWVRESTTRIIIEAGNADAENIHVTIATNPPNIAQCPGCRQCDEDWSVNLLIPLIPAGTRLVIDGASRDVYVADDNNCKVGDGWKYIEPYAPFEVVPDMGPCAAFCVCVASHEGCVDRDTFRVWVERIDRES
jgi:hypothetical protein